LSRKNVANLVNIYIVCIHWNIL